MNMSASIRVKRSRKWARREVTILQDHKISLEKLRKQAWDHHTSNHRRAKRIKYHLKKKIRERDEETSAVLVFLEVSSSVGRGTRCCTLPPPQSLTVYFIVLQRWMVGLGGAPHWSRSLVYQEAGVKLWPLCFADQGQNISCAAAASMRRKKAWVKWEKTRKDLPSMLQYF